MSNRESALEINSRYRLIVLTMRAFVIALFSVICVWGATAKAASLSDYTLGSGDLVSIQVFGEGDLSFEVRLSDAGTIPYPFLGEVNAVGKTTGQLASLITRGLKGDYLIEPNVNVTVLEYRQFFINGEVKKPGGYPFQPGLTLQKAVALAGGFTERASSSKMFVVSDGGADPVPISLNSSVEPGDIITIEQSFF
ncbi:MAG: polysaccharide biosynthesis/export family protein [Pontibacterium sp.]